MLFHTWPFLVFALIVLPVFFALRNTRLWIPWLMFASYFFYGWWNPYYLSLVAYSTLLDYTLVALMDHCPRDPVLRQGPDGVLFWALVVSVTLTLACFATAFAGPPTLRPTLILFGGL